MILSSSMPDIGGLLKYSRAGKFLQQIGSTGRGPGEYQLLRSYSIDKNKQLIMGYASWKRSLLFYDFNGNFIKSINPSYNGAADYRAISQFGNSFVIVQDPFMPETIDTTQVFNMAIVDNDFNAIKILTNPTYNNRKTEIIENGYDPQNAWDNFYQTTPPIYKIRANSFDFLYYGGDIVYRVTEDFKLDTLYSLKIGDQFPFDVLHFRCHPLEYFNYLLIRDFQETPEYVFFDFGYKKKQYKARCRKDDGYIDVLANNAIIEDKYASERLYTRRREGIKPSFTNDLNGGGSFNPQWADEKYWSICYSAYELMNTNLDSLSTANVKIPQKREQLINIIKNLKETDGPVLMIAHLNLSQNEE